MKTRSFLFIRSMFAGGLFMWILAGLWHNLVLPSLDSRHEAHHEGIWIMLLAYFILAGLMTYFYTQGKREDASRLRAFQLGALIGILWVFPHGLTMAGAHGTSILYEIKNALWHIVEQGAGGVVIALAYGKRE